MIIKYTKQHPVGIEKGTVQKVDSNFGNRMISEGYAEEAKQTDLDKFRKTIEDKKKKQLEALQKKNAEKVTAKKEPTAKQKDCGCNDKPKAEGEEECEECKKKAAAKKTVGAGTRKRTTKKTTTTKNK